MAGTSLSADRVVLGQANGAGFWIAPVGTTLPTDSTTALDAAFVTPGYLSEDGVSLGGDYSTDSLNAWQSIAPIRKIITGRTMTVGATLLETSPEALGLYFDATAPTETTGSFSLTVSSAPNGVLYSAVVDLADGAQTLRFVFPRVQLSEAGELVATRTGALGYPITLEALDDNGALAYVYRDGPAALMAPLSGRPLPPLDDNLVD